MFKISRGKRDNLRIIFHNIPLKHMLQPSLEGSRQDVSKKGLQHTFSLRNK